MNARELTALCDRLSDDLTVRPGSGERSVPPRALAEFCETLRPVDDDRELLASTAALLRLRNIADHALARMASAAGRVGLPARKKVRSTTNLLTELGAAPAVAHRIVRLGATLQSVPQVARAMRDGALAAERGDAVVRGLAHVAARVDLSDEQRQTVIDSLMVHTVPKHVEDRARRWALELAPDEPSDEAVPVSENIELNEMTLVQGDDGRVLVTVDFDALAGEELSAALDPLCRPVPEPDGSPDARTVKRRRADALAQVVRTYLAGSDRPESGGVLPHVTLIVPAAVARERKAAAEEGSAEAGVGTVPEFGFTGPVSPRTARMVMCEASVCTALVDDAGVPLNVGREQRLFPPGIRKALVVRDRGCAFPGCGAPATWCDAHHVEHWEHGGETSLENGVLLCRRHHTLIHHGGWEVFIGHDGHPWFVAATDPAHPERPREPLRSHGRRTLTNLPGAA
ncbi:DUF222 domain-containing protein [Gordonia iterans]